MKKKLFAFTLLPVLGLMVLGANSASAFGGGFGPGHGEGRHGGGVHKEYLADLSEEEREELREAKRDMREDRREAFEEFSGLTHEEIREIKQSGGSIGDALEDNGVTRDEAEDFLNEQAEIKIDWKVETFDLDDDEEESLRERISNFVERVLNRWFGD